MGYTVAQVTMTVDMVIVYKDHLLLIERRKWPYQGMWALPGGKLDEGESLEQAAARELYEETGVGGIPLLQVHTYSDPGRDPRGRYVSVAYAAVLPHEIAIQAGDDATSADWFPIDHLPLLAFDHARIVHETLAHLHHSERLNAL